MSLKQIEPGAGEANKEMVAIADRTGSDAFALIVGTAAISMAISLKRIADALDTYDGQGRPQGSVLYWLEMIASAANAGRS